MTYSTVVTYLLWLTLGWFGVHHFYLRRDRHAFVWLWTLGGGCGIGWLAEVFRLPEYVRQANMDALYASGQVALPAAGLEGDRPPFGVKRFVGEFVFSMWLGGLSLASIPEEVTDIYRWLMGIVAPAGVAIGVHTVANIGVEQCDLIVCLAFAYVMFPFFLMSSPDSSLNTLTMTALLTSLAVNYNCGRTEDDEDDDDGDDRGHWWTRIKTRLPLLHLRHALASRAKRYRRKRPARCHLRRRIAIFVGASVVLWILLLSAFYHNTYISTDYGEKVKVRVALEHFFSSPAWTAFRETGWKVLYRAWQNGTSKDFFSSPAWTAFRETGWKVIYGAWQNGSAKDFFREFGVALDPEGEQSAYKILNLTQSATEKQINDRYREVVKKFHPDKFIDVDDEEKKKVQERFIKIQQAYERISTIKAKRMRKNKLRNEL